MPESVSIETARHVARLARLQLQDEELEAACADLEAMLEHVAALQSVDVEDVEPLSHPSELTNRLCRDEPSESMAAEDVLDMAPSVLTGYLTVPKVLGEGD